ncbi:MAG TPA: penicillin-binding protein 2 [Streptosporangiaceae bacterium]
MRPGGRRPGARYPRPAFVAAARPILRRGRPGRRLNISLLCIVFVLSLFAGRLVQLQGLDGPRYRNLAEHLRLTPQSIPVVRGSITASDGRVLALTVQTDLIFADPVQIPVARREQVAAAVAGPLGMSSAKVLALLTYPSSPQYVVLARSVTSPTAARIAALHLPGIHQTPSYTRSYPNGDLAANLIGFATQDSAGDLRGQAGLEYKYNSLLAGRDGSEEVEHTTTGQPIPLTDPKVKPEVPAGNLRLTIQSDIQWYAERACAAQVKATKAKNCTIVVMDPKTGKILALAQYPEFSPAGPKNLAATADMPVANVFQPGSTGKVITVAAALEHGGQTPLSAYTVPDSIVVDGFPFRDAETHPTLRYTIAGILANSSNVGMVQVVQHVSPKVQYQMFKAFGLGEPTGLGLPGESQGLLPPPSQWWGDERYTLSFGQGVAANAVQMAGVYATIANGGVRVQPSIVAGTTSGAGTFTQAPRPASRRVLSTRTASELMAMLQQVPRVNQKAGEPWGIINGYSIAAKTGTAQVPDPARGGCLCNYGSSYIGIAPASNPQLVVAVNLQDPKTSNYFGIAVAGPVFNHVMKFALQTMKVAPDGGRRPDVRLTAP